MAIKCEKDTEAKNSLIGTVGRLDGSKRDSTKVGPGQLLERFMGQVGEVDKTN